MNNRILTTGEILTITQNMKAIEKSLGHPLPSGMVDPNSIKDHLLTTGEVLTICSNINAYDKARGIKWRDYDQPPSSSNDATLTEIAAAVIVLAVICGILLLVEAIFGINIL